MAKTDPEADVSEHTSENEGVEQADAGGSKLTLEQRQQKLAQLRSRMVRQNHCSVTSGVTHIQTPAFVCSSEQSLSDRGEYESQGIGERCGTVGQATEACRDHASKSRRRRPRRGRRETKELGVDGGRKR